MPKRDEIIKRLRAAANQARKPITEQQLSVAAESLVKKASVQKQDLRTLGESVANDPEIFANTDTDDMNDVLGRLGEK